MDTTEALLDAIATGTLPEATEPADLSESVVDWHEVATETMANLLISQRKRKEAVIVLETLASKHPEKSKHYRARAAALRKGNRR